MTTKPCVICGAPKKPGHPKWCVECRWSKQPMHVQVAEAQRRLSMVPLEERRARVPEREWPAGRRWCAGCQTFVRLMDCPPSGSRCRPCSSAASHAQRTKAVYGLDAEAYNALLHQQDGKCAICRNGPGKKRLAVDHSHQTNEVRGLLCSRCNHELLGAAHDSVRILQSAVDYLLHPPATGRWTPPELKRDDGLHGEKAS